MAWYRRCLNVFRTERLNRELDDELAYHLAETADRLMEQGVPEHKALRMARLQLGNYFIQKERTRDMNISGWLDRTRADVVYGLRQLRLAPGFTAVAILSLALGIGANTAIFELVDAIRLKMLPVKDPRQLALIDWTKNSSRGGRWSTRSANFTYAQWEQIRDYQSSFSEVLAWSATRFNLTNGGEPRFADGLYVSGSFFPVLGVNAILGRTLTYSDDNATCNAGAVISYSFWQREYGGDSNILGRQITLDGHTLPVIGVTAAQFFGVEVGNRYDAALPLCADRLLASDGKGRIPGRTEWWLSIMGRLKPGATVQSADINMHALSPSIMRATVPAEYGTEMAKRFEANKLIVTDAGTGVSDLRQQYERPLWLLVATTGLVLLIACANLANLLLARATVREPEIAVRLAMGASRWRVMRQLLAESLLLAIAGAVVGAALAAVLSRSLLAYISTSDNPVFVQMGSDWRVLTFTGGLAIVTCLLFGLLPAFRSTHLSPAAAMRCGGRTVTAGRERFGLRRGLVATQVALSLVLLVGSFLFVRSFQNLLQSDPGFSTEGTVLVSVDFDKTPLAERPHLSVFRDLNERMKAIPGVISEAQVGSPPVSGSGWNNAVGIDGAPAAESKKNSWFNRASPGYFRLMKTRVIAGREFDEHDTLSSPKVALVNEEFAKEYFGGKNPVGHTFHREVGAGQQEPLFQVVGMVANTKYYNLQENFRPIGYFPIAQDEAAPAGANLVLRIGAASPGSVMKEAKAVVAAMSPSASIQFRLFSEQLADSLMRDRLMATVSGGFGFLASLLATLGLYGVISYMVAQRRKEIGVRMALGADRVRVLIFVLREAALLVAIGIVAGLGLSLWVGQAAAALLYGIKPRDLASLIGASVLLSVIALAASYLPARRAAAEDPMSSLRVE